MKTERQLLMVKSATPPSVEVDFDSHAAYVRFKTGRVAKTIARQGLGTHVAVDLDSKGEVLGIEAVGFTELNLGKIILQAKVEAPNVDFSKVKIRQTPAMVGA